MSHPHHKIHYIEFAATDMARAKQFYVSGLSAGHFRIGVRNTLALTPRARA